MRSKRMISLLICIVMAFGCMNGVVYAEEALSNPSEGGDSLLTEKEVASGAIVAEEVSSDTLQAGDQLLVVFDYSKALSRKPTYNKKNITGVDVTVRHTKTRTVMTGAIPADAAVFTLEAAPNGILLKCDEGYLTASMNENGLYYSETQDECSVWQFSEGVFLYNPNKVREYSGKTYNDYHMQYYNSYFTVYGKSSYAKPETYTMHFFKLGNSDPSESIVEDSYYTVPVFETSDVHGNLADTGGEKTKYTLSYISDKVKDARGYGDEEDRDRAILLDGGDIFQGNSMSYLLSGASMSAAYQMMGYDAVTIGNHEFDWGIESTIDSDCTLIDYALGGTQGENTVPVIVSNLLKDGERVSFSKDYIILEKKAYNLDGAYVNVRVGVIGFAGDYGGSIISDQFVKKGYSINEDFDSLNALAADLETNQGCNATILLAHEDASSIASSVGENSVIDLVLGGHTHRNSSGKTSWGLTYLEPSGNAKAYCTADMAFSVNDDNSVSFEGVQNPFVVSTAQVTDQMTKEDANVGELDPDLVDLTDQVIDELDDILYETVGYITRSAYRDEYLAGSGNRASTYGNWVTSINRRNCQADVAFVNSGGMRTDMVIEEGQDRRYVTVGDIYNMFPFGNYMYTYLLTYEDLLEALNYSLTSLGKGLLSCMTGVKCYYTDQTVNAIVAPDGTLAYHAGVWTDGWKDQLITVVVDEYIATTNRVSDNMSNPFVAWNETDRLVDTFNIDNQGALRVLREESATHDGLLSFDDMPCYIVGDYRESAKVIVAPEPKELVFSGESQELVTAGEATGGTTQYALGTATEATEPYTTSIPTATNAGTYYVWYKVHGDDNHNDTNPACVISSISSPPSGPSTISATVTFKVAHGAWDDGTKDNKTVTLTGYSPLTLSTSQIPAVGTKPDEGYKAGSWDTVPATSITRSITFTYSYVKKPVASITKEPTARDLTENGKPQELVTAGEATGGKTYL